MKQQTKEKKTQSSGGIIKDELQLPSLTETNYFKTFILPNLLTQHYVRPQNKLFEQFLPFDPSIVDVFDQNDMCDEPMRTILILHHSKYMLGSKWFLNKDYLLKEQICRIKKNYEFIREDQYLVWLFIDFFSISQKTQIDEDLTIMVYNCYTCNVFRTGDKSQWCIRIEEMQLQREQRKRFQNVHDLESELIGNLLKITMVLCDNKIQEKTRQIFSTLLVGYSFLGFDQLLFVQAVDVKKQSNDEQLLAKIPINNLGKLVSQYSCFKKQATLHSPFHSIVQSKVYFKDQKYFFQLYSAKKQQILLRQSFTNDTICWLFTILHYFHSNLSISIGNTSFSSCLMDRERIFFFTNFSEASPFSLIRGANDIIQLTDSVLRNGYCGTFKKDLQALLLTPEQNQILKIFHGIISKISSIFPQFPQFKK